MNNGDKKRSGGVSNHLNWGGVKKNNSYLNWIKLNIYTILLVLSFFVGKLLFFVNFFLSKSKKNE